MQAKTFVFGPYRADWKAGKLEFDYVITFKDGDDLKFTEKVEFAGGARSCDDILPHISLMLGISYYKLYVPPEIKLNFSLAKEQAEFWNTVYRKGLGEFWYRNGLTPRSPSFPTSPGLRPTSPYQGEVSNKALLGIGGGKESIVAAELLKKEGMKVTGFVVETQKASKVIYDVIDALEIPVLTIKRFLDSKLFEAHPGSYNGHVPISAIYAWLGLLLAKLQGFSWVAVGNEYSSNFGNVEWHGETINHQWAKSGEFEQLFQNYVRQCITPDITYFSPLRPFHEIRITEMLTQLPVWGKIKLKFSSCNRNFIIHGSEVGWCGECPKCAFTFVMLAAFLPKEEVVQIFGKDLFGDKNLVPLYKDLLGEGAMKPFDCVGTFAEAQAALWKAGKRKIERGEQLFRETMRVQAAETLPHRFFFSGIQKALILGYGREGKITEQFLQKFYPDIEIGIADQNDGPDYLDRQGDYEVAIKTPGIPKRLVTIPYTTATNVFFSRVKNLTIGVTGSKGKSTTASLITAMLSAEGKKVHLLGNIGKPMLEALLSPINPETVFVLELSSQQLEDIRYSPNIAVITTLFPEHMDYHGSAAAYYAAKKNIFRFQKPGDVFLQNRPEIPVPDSGIPLLGEGNRQNIQAALAVAQHLQISREATSQAIRTFKPLPHRLEFVGEFHGIHFYDNASSTTPESTIEALKTIPNVATIFLGGLDRGYDFTNLVLEIENKKIQNAVLFPDTGAQLKKLLPKTIQTLETRSMAEAVRFALRHTQPGKAVLLSAASPSYSNWANFEAQGNEFQRSIKTLA